MKLYKKLSKLQLRSNYFTQRVINMWNSLPATVVSASTVSLFKHELDEYWTSSGYGYVYKGLVPKLYFWLYDMYIH